MGPEQYVVLGLTITTAYTVFGLTGFGAAMVAVPVLVQFIPLHFVVPMLLLLDLVVTTLVGLRNRAIVSRRELAALLPFMLLGVALGTTALAKVEPRWLLIGLGTFVLLMTSRTLLSRPSTTGQVHGLWAGPAGIVGGAFSALFGTGGPIYTMYLSRRLSNIDQFRATISTVILLSALVRLLAFAMGGLLQQPDLLRGAAFALPFSLAGLGIGSLLRQRVPAHTVRKALLLFLAASGASVMWRGLTL